MKDDHAKLRGDPGQSSCGLGEGLPRLPSADTALPPSLPWWRGQLKFRRVSKIATNLNANKGGLAGAGLNANMGRLALPVSLVKNVSVTHAPEASQ